MSWTTRIGTNLAGYRIEGLIGRGGMSVVYLAEDRLGRKVALKVLAPTLSNDPDFQQRFRRESRKTASIDHPNVIPVYDAGEEGGMFYISMRYVDGPDLGNLVASRGHLDVDRMLPIIEQVAGALDATHAVGLVHRDVKPQNILIDARGTWAYLSDFGIVKHTLSGSVMLTHTGFFLGTPDYCAPEQIEGGTVDARTDIYALGGVAYTCLVGKAPYERDAEVAMMQAHLTEPPPVPTIHRPDLPNAMDEVIATAMAKNPDDRYDSCWALALALRAASMGPAELAPTRLAGGERRHWASRTLRDAPRRVPPSAAASALWLVLDLPDGASRDVCVDAETAATVGDLVEGLARHVGSRPSPAGEASALYLRRLREWLDPNASLASLGLRRGDRLSLGSGGADRVGGPAQSSAIPEGSIRLLVSAGPASGRRFTLEPGLHLVGRDAASDVVLDDPSLSRRHLRLHVAGGTVRAEDAGSSNGTFIEDAAVPPGSPRTVDRGEAIIVGRSVLRLEQVVPTAPAGLAAESGLIPILRPPRAGGSYADSIHHLGAQPLLRQSHELAQHALSAFATARAAEVESRRAAAPDAPELLERARMYASTLWERRPEDADFLDLRVGVGDLPLQSRVDVAGGGDERHLLEVYSQLRGLSSAPALPVTVPLRRVGVLGLAGPESSTSALARWLVVQAAVLHSPSELAVAAAVPSERIDTWSFLKWLPHTSSTVSPLDSQLAAGEAGADALLRAVAHLLQAPAGASDGPAVLLLLHEGVVRDRDLVSRVLADGLVNAISVVWIGQDARHLPAECAAVCELDQALAQLSLTIARNGGQVENVTADGLSVELAREAALSLAPVVDAGAHTSRLRLPRRVALAELLELSDPDPRVIEARWGARAERLAGVIGVTASGPLTVDLDRPGGLRALVAGMPGSGKSELLRTVIASLASSHAPDRLTFLLVDYERGGAFRNCVELPHTVGLVTDIDDRRAERAHASLLDEIHRRQALVDAAGVSSLGELTRREPESAPPALLIIVDEFAALAENVPLFIDSALHLAQKGRSLGIHLLLATQWPRRASSAAIRPNMNLRVAMRMSEAGESRAVIEADAAVGIPPGLPGRAYAWIPDGPEIVEFQTAWTSGVPGTRRGAAPVSVRDVDFGGTDASAGAVHFEAGRGASDLERLVDAATGAAAELGPERPPSPW